MPRYRQGSMMGFVSTNDLSAATNLGKIVKIDSANAPDHVVLSTAATDKHVGVLVDTPAASQTGTVRLRNCDGTNFVQLGGTVAVGDAITSNASGVGIATTSAGDQILGYALSAGASGDIAEIQPSTGKY